MSGIARYSSISAIGSFTALSAASTDWLALDAGKCSGGGGATLRTEQEDAVGTDGVFVFPRFDGEWVITLAGDLIIGSAGDETGYLAAIDTLYASLETQLLSMKSTSAGVVHAGGTIGCLLHAPLDHSWDGLTLSVKFGLIVDPSY